MTNDDGFWRGFRESLTIYGDLGLPKRETLGAIAGLIVLALSVGAFAAIVFLAGHLLVYGVRMLL